MVSPQTPYNYKADIWSLGISVIEMTDEKPPHSKVHPMRALFLIGNATDPPRIARDPGKWSDAMHDFVARCLVRDQSEVRRRRRCCCCCCCCCCYV